MSEFLAYGEATWHSGINRDAIAFHTNTTDPVTDHYKVYQTSNFKYLVLQSALTVGNFFPGFVFIPKRSCRVMGHQHLSTFLV